MRKSAARPLGAHDADLTDAVRDATRHATRDAALYERDEQLAEQAREAERREIACELHDTVIQPLAALTMSFESLRQQTMTPGMFEAYMSAWKDLAQEALDSLRCTLAGLHTQPYAQLALPDALRRYLAPQVRSRGLRLLLEAREWPSDLPVDLTSSLYLVVREALTNVEKHAHASEATILLEADRAEVRIFLADNGVGFSLEEMAQRVPERPGHGVGLGSMRDRIHKLGGRCDIATAPGQGVRVELSVPRPKGKPSRKVTSLAREPAPTPRRAPAATPKRARKGQASPYTH